MFRVIAVDDEKKALERLKRIAEEDNRLSLGGCFTDPEEAIDYVRQNMVDLVFLDIEMPEISGLELAEILNAVKPGIDVIFITAYDHYALKAFQAHAIGYLLKPLDRKELMVQIDLLEQKRILRKTDTGAEPLLVSCLGSFSCKVGENGASIRWRTSKAEELFALFIHYRGKPISKEILIDALWPETEPEKAANHFRVTCTYLRNTLAEKGFSGILRRERDSYWIETKYLCCDLYSFAAVAEAAEDTAILESEHASALYQGAYFEGKPYEWALETRVWLENGSKRIRHRLATIYFAGGEDQKGCMLLEKIRLQDPLEEEAAERLIYYRLRSGEEIEAIRLYREYEQRLWKELGAAPSSRLRELVSQMHLDRSGEL